MDPEYSVNYTFHRDGKMTAPMRDEFNVPKPHFGVSDDSEALEIAKILVSTKIAQMPERGQGWTASLMVHRLSPDPENDVRSYTGEL